MPDPVLAGVDGSRASMRAAVWAAVEASTRSWPLHLLHVHEPAPLGAPQPSAMVEGTADGQRLRPAEQWIDLFADACRAAADGLVLRTEIVTGRPLEVLAERDQHAGLLVFGASGVSGLRLGSAARTLVHRIERPIVVVRGDDDGPVVVGIDETGRHERLAEFAFDLARRRGKDLVALHAWARSDTYLATEMRPWQAAYPDVVVHLEVTSDHPVDALLARSKTAGTLVLGSHGRGPIRRLILGAVSYAVTENASCSVAIVRGAQA